MGFSVSERVIKLLCGKTAFEKGQEYYLSGRVDLIDNGENHGSVNDTNDNSYSDYEAIVAGSKGSNVDVTARIDRDGDVTANCSCAEYYRGGPFCKHIAAVMVNVLDLDQGLASQGRTAASSLHNGGAFTTGVGVLTPRTFTDATRKSRASAKDQQLVDTMLGMFGNSRQRPSGTGIFMDIRMPLNVELICKPFSYNYGSVMLGIEMKVGPKRLYIVQKIRDFLQHVHRGEAYEFSKHFIYDPSLHSFHKEDNAVIQKLIEILLNEKMYRERSSSYSPYANHMGGDRLLPIPPFFWDTLLPFLSAAKTVYFQQEDTLFEGIHFSNEAPPLSFEFDQAEENGYRLEVLGLEKITVMEDYGIVLTEGKLLKLPSQECRRLADMKKMLEDSRDGGVRIAPEQMEPFMDKVIPGLMKLGSVHIADAIADRVVQTKLQARLYLDRVRDRLLAGLEFQYGDIIINPIDDHNKARGTDIILMRDSEAEHKILELMEHEYFAKTESGYIMSDEDAEYDFLYHKIPLLEQLLEVYATTAVKEKLHTGTVPPKVSLTWNEKTDWLDFKFDMEGIPESEIVLVLRSLQDKRKYYRLPNGALLPLESEEFQEIITFMNELGIRQDDLKGTEFTLPVVRGLHLSASDEKGDAVKLGKGLRKLLANMRNPENLDYPVPDRLVPVLRDYQVFGFQWLKTLAHYRFGGILADDMGLGKTLQSIAFLLSELPDIRQGGKPALIVAPASLVYNWHNELKKFTPEIKAVIADGSLTERTRILRNTGKADVIITSYPLLRRDVHLYAKPSFHTLILDEAQVIKNHVTQTAQAVRVLQARYRFALTGTPVENALEDLWSIFGAVFPELFPGKKAFHDLPREVVAKRARPFLLRRLKTDVLKELPDKIESLQASELLPEQKKLYVAYLARLQKEALKHLNGEDFRSNRIKILAGLTRLRQLCCHPSLFVEGYQGSSAKFEQLLEIIEECRSSGKRMLVFSQFTEMLKLIGRELGLQGVPYFYLDGQTRASQRVELCNQFNDGERDLFLISLKAGGTGLNLTGADTVILYDLWWNPAVEQQAADRAHRIGQKKVVQVIRLVTQGTVEDKMYELQQKKKNLIDEVIQPGQEALSTLTEQDIREILMI
ncbi:DEAD/DEAH box helicase [Paenibacillus wynnii]|uniref:Helicase SNF n=1 Tax=Paenibacillus wynnii TaxID=268407 RepID=A0A098M756_9BACL|nr:DEAD/DEAH box helicase [Paenibacillus wynnii]KGE18360.1 helicase SNF [Paenibacillus wynnii]